MAHLGVVTHTATPFNALHNQYNLTPTFQAMAGSELTKEDLYVAMMFNGGLSLLLAVGTAATWWKRANYFRATLAAGYVVMMVSALASIEQLGTTCKTHPSVLCDVHNTLVNNTFAALLLWIGLAVYTAVTKNTSPSTPRRQAITAATTAPTAPVLPLTAPALAAPASTVVPADRDTAAGRVRLRRPPRASLPSVAPPQRAVWTGNMWRPQQVNMADRMRIINMRGVQDDVNDTDVGEGYLTLDADDADYYTRASEK